MGTEGRENAVLSENGNVERSLGHREGKKSLKQVNLFNDMYQF